MRETAPDGAEILFTLFGEKISSILLLPSSTPSIAMPDSTRQQLASNRKQNVACDACRAKKIRCGRESIADIVSGVPETLSIDKSFGSDEA
jgi:hypothetical protein